MKTVETGDIGYFYRNRVDVDQASGPKDIQSLYMVLMPDERQRARLFVIGKKKMPAIKKGKTSPEEREWAMNIAVGSPRKIANALAPVKYETKTRGTRVQGEAIPVAEGRYEIIEDERSSHLLQRLDTPTSLGKPHKALRLRQTADYVLSVRSPKVDVPGFPDKKPDYPKALMERFADERWLPVDDPRFINYENAQFLILGARNAFPESAPDLKGNASLLEKLGISGRQWPMDALKKGEYAKVQCEMGTRASGGDRSAGGRKGGATATKRPSAAGIAKAVKGSEFPCKRSELIKMAKENKASSSIIETLENFPNRKFQTMSDVQKALGEVR